MVLMVMSKYLGKLSEEEREKLKRELLEIQKGVCFICEDAIDLKIQDTEIDHIVPLAIGGKDEKNNLAVTHAKCNREKEDANLEVARIIKRFRKIWDEVYKVENRAPDLSHILKKFGGSKYALPVSVEEGKVRFSLENVESFPNIYESPIYEDRLSGFKSFFAELPIEYVFHDEKGINPRKLSDRVCELVKEFYRKRPQLHIGLARINLEDGNGRAKVFIFDGQHKAAAQILLGNRMLLLRVFLNPDLEVLAQTNERAGTDLRQVAFDKSVVRQLGATILAWKVQNFQREKGLTEDDYSFSERGLVNHFKGEGKEIKKLILDFIKNRIITDTQNRIRDYINFGGREKDRPISYSSIEKTFFSLFLCQDILDVRPFLSREREREIKQMIELMNIIVDIILQDYDFDIGSWKIEEEVRKEKEGTSTRHIPDQHLRVTRIVKEEIMYNWLKLVKQIIQMHFSMQGIPIEEEKLFQEEFQSQLWTNIKNFLKNLKDLPLWIDREKTYVFSAKQTYDYWASVFKTGSTSDGIKLLPEGINLISMIK
ncbi:MAG: HNH endonuclease signature motif containing protein [Candidatus Woesearchaeota archaeon]